MGGKANTTNDQEQNTEDKKVGVGGDGVAVGAGSSINVTSAVTENEFKALKEVLSFGTNAISTVAKNADTSTQALKEASSALSGLEELSKPAIIGTTVIAVAYFWSKK